MGILSAIALATAPATTPQYTFGYYCSQILNGIFSNPILTSNPVLFVLIISTIPSIFFPVPKSEFIISLLTNGGDATSIVIATTVGNLIGEFLLYSIVSSKTWHLFFRRREARHDIQIKHFFHRYSWLLFVFAPFIPLFGLDVLVIFAAFRKVKFSHIVGFMAIGLAAKNILTVYLVLQGLYFLPQILRICTTS
jgi:membrane protein YqaA with SNARE-associated domain